MGAPAGVEPLLGRLGELRDAEGKDAAESPVSLAKVQVLLHYAPTALASGNVLAPWLRLAESGTELGAALLDAFSHDVGDGESALHHHNLYLAALEATGVRVDEAHSHSFSTDTRFSEADFELALAAWGARDLPSALGVHLAISVLGLPYAVRQALPVGTPLLDGARRQGSEQRAQRCLVAYAKLASERGEPVDWAALWQSVHGWFEARRTWAASLCLALTPAREAMLELVRAKASHARGYHRSVPLWGRSLDDWMSSSRDAATFLERLAASRYVVIGKPEHSPLIRASSEFGGAMFGTFTADELDVMRHWIRSLESEVSAPARPTTPAAEVAGRSWSLGAGRLAASKAGGPRGFRHRWRSLYLELLREPARVAGDAARRRALRDPGDGLIGRSPPPHPGELLKQGLWPYSAERLAAWIHARHRAQVDERSALSEQAANLLEREEVLWLLQQLAPAAFVDGAWLSGLASAERLRSPSASLLFRIYRDELGAGKPEQHHGNVLRRALEDAGVHLPPCDTEEFARSPRLLDAAFALPAWWLSLATECDQRFPELLGLNLAVELAGLGQGYELAASLLRKHGIDPYFFVLHNSIDNPASGHSAWSSAAIASYMDDIASKHGAGEAERAWLRVWSGFRSYAEANKPLHRAIGLRLGPPLLARGARATLARLF